MEQVEEDERGLLRAVRRVLPEGGELLLVIDQLEEIFTLVEDPEDTAFILQSLYEAVVDPHSPLRCDRHVASGLLRPAADLPAVR